MVRVSKYALAPFIVVAGLTTACLAGSLPGGASLLVETHGKWQLNCVDEAATLTCGISQTQIDPETRQQLISIEMRDDGDGGLTGAPPWV